jgi:hypothetical protein
VATHATATITTRVYVQVHNRGVLPANNVRVMCLLANASAGLPALPAGFDVSVRNGTPVTSASWQTLGIATLNDVRPGFPKVAAFDLTSDKLPPPANLAGNDHHCVLALLHHADDQFTNPQTSTDTLSLTERKSAHKNLKVVQFTGTLPAPPVVIPLRINNAGAQGFLLTGLQVRLNGYLGRVRLVVPAMRTAGSLEQALDGAKLVTDFADFERWADLQRRLIRGDGRTKLPFNKEWTRQRVEDITKALAAKTVIEAGDKNGFAVHQIRLEAGGYHTVFLMLDRPRGQKLGTWYPIDCLQTEERRKDVIGGMTVRIDFVPAPRRAKVPMILSVWTRGARRRRVIHARLQDVTGHSVRPSSDTEVMISVQHENGKQDPIGAMRYHRAWGSFYHKLADEPRVGDTLKATAMVRGAKVAEVEVKRL